ncbi:MAG: hypothetical protein U1C57_02030 [Candidatus Doudnabacteria bacterium]|nr:hypothetical protein [bacterium]MDZ4243861.1 hypothetical protein [Candidatus Doudnabacteria bacterium]
MMRCIKGRNTLWHILWYIATVAVIVLNTISHNAQPPAREILYHIGMGVGVLSSVGLVTFGNIRFIKTRRRGEWLTDLFATLLVLGCILFFYSDGRTIFSAPRIVSLILLEFVVTSFIWQVARKKPATSNS